MTEPVVYLHEYDNGEIAYSKSIVSAAHKTTPLYTLDKLHPRVKMTQKQYDRLMYDKENTDLSTCLAYFIEHDGVNKFGKASDNLMGFLKQEDIARAWLNPQETIDIVPDMKWFVRSKEADENGTYQFLFSINKPNGYLPVEDKENNSGMKQFDTKEEAELWCNPLCEAVILPI